MAMIIGAMLTAVGAALIYKTLKGSIWPSSSMKCGSKSNAEVIEIDDYELIDEIPNQAPEGYKVKVH